MTLFSTGLNISIKDKVFISAFIDSDEWALPLFVKRTRRRFSITFLCATINILINKEKNCLK